MTPPLLRDEGGAVLVELAVLAPLLLLLFFGSVEMVQALQAQKKLAHVSAAIGDVIARERSVTDAEVADVLGAGPAMMAPFPADALGARVMSFSASPEGAVSLDWRLEGPAYAGGAPASVPPGYLKPGESVIVTDASYAYRPLFSLIVRRPLAFQKRTFFRPRLVAAVRRDGP